MGKWYIGGKPGELKPVPWLAPRAVDYLEKLLRPDWCVVEHGGGGSTLWFAERVKTVTTYEEKQTWADAIREKAPQNVTVVHSSGTPDKSRLFDLLLIDGEPVENRGEWLGIARNIIRPGGWVVLDNANRPEYRQERKELGKYAISKFTVNSNAEAGYKYLVTEFWQLKEDQ